MDTDNVFFKNLSVVIPLRNMSGRLNNLFTEIRYLVAEDTQIILVDDGSIDGSSNIISELSNNPIIYSITLNRNYGQHAAIFAGVLSSNEDVIITMDEDGEHDPLIIPKMLRKIDKDNSEIVYAKFNYRKTDIKELSSVYAKKFIATISRDPNIRYISSFRAVKGSVFRSAAVYANNGSFLDVALGWISRKVATVETSKRNTLRKSTYSYKGLVNHFSRLFFAAGIKPLIFLFNLGWIISLGSLVAILIIVYRKVFSSIPVQGWVSNIIVIVFFGGIMISSIGLVARYLSSIVETSSGKPFFTIKNQK